MVVQIVRKNFGLKLLSLTLALIGWAYFRFAGNPSVAAARFNQQMSLPITVVNLPIGYVAQYSEKEAIVTVESKPGEPPAKTDEMKAVLDVAEKTAGVYNVPVQLVAPGLVVASLSPASVTLTIERLEQRYFPLTVHYVGAQKAGIVVTGQRLTPAAVSVEGPTSSLAQIAAVRVDVTLPNAPTSVDEMLRPVAEDAAGDEIGGLQLGPDLVRAQLRFASGHLTKP
jgi:YbbR domain-containing protein